MEGLKELAGGGGRWRNKKQGRRKGGMETDIWVEYSGAKEGCGAEGRAAVRNEGEALGMAVPQVPSTAAGTGRGLSDAS